MLLSKSISSFLCLLPGACATCVPASLVSVGIGLIAHVPSGAESSTFAFRCGGDNRSGVPKPTAKILLESDGLQVPRIYAEANAALVIELQPIRDESAKQSVSDSMSESSFVLAIVENPIAATLNTPSPQPATRIWIWRNEAQEATHQCKLDSSHGTPFSRIGQGHLSASTLPWPVPILARIAAI